MYKWLQQEEVPVDQVKKDHQQDQVQGKEDKQLEVIFFFLFLYLFIFLTIGKHLKQQKHTMYVNKIFTK